MKNWKTSLFGVIAATALLFGKATDEGKKAPAVADIVATVGIALTGLAARDGAPKE